MACIAPCPRVAASTLNAVQSTLTSMPRLSQESGPRMRGQHQRYRLVAPDCLVAPFDPEVGMVCRAREGLPKKLRVSTDGDCVCFVFCCATGKRAAVKDTVGRRPSPALLRPSRLRGCQPQCGRWRRRAWASSSSSRRVFSRGCSGSGRWMPASPPMPTRCRCDA